MTWRIGALVLAGVMLSAWVLTMVLDISWGFPFVFPLAAAIAAATAASVDWALSHAARVRYAATVRLVGEAMLRDRSSVGVEALVLTLDDEWLTAVYEHNRAVDESIWKSRMERGDCSER